MKFQQFKYIYFNQYHWGIEKSVDVPDVTTGDKVRTITIKHRIMNSQNDYKNFLLEKQSFPKRDNKDKK